MKNFVKDVLIFLVVMVFVTLLIQNASTQNKNVDQPNVQESIDLFEDQISQGIQIGDGQDNEEKEEVKSNGNIFSKMVNGFANLFTKIINFLMRLIMRLVSVFIA